MPGKTIPKIDPNQTMSYEIRLRGHLGRQWAEWFEGMAVTLEDTGDTLISGPVADQAALYGLLRKVSGLGLVLLSVNCIQSEKKSEYGQSK